MSTLQPKTISNIIVLVISLKRFLGSQFMYVVAKPACLFVVIVDLTGHGLCYFCVASVFSCVVKNFSLLCSIWADVCLTC